MDNADQPKIPEEYKGRDVGELAENTLQTWISGVTSATLNPVRKDKEGWDFILEFPFRAPESGRPWDTAMPRVQCFIQVKGTDGERKERNVKLDNWQKFITTPLPAFFLIYEFADDSLPKAAYLVHVHHEWMEKVLKRLRKSRPGESPPLHEQSVTLTWSEREAIEPLTGTGLVEQIIKHVGDDMDNYVQEKQELRRTLGLDAPYLIHIQSTFASEQEMYENVVDFGLGLKDWLPAKMTPKKDVRFGIAAETEGEIEGLLRFTPVGVPFTLIFQNSVGSKVARYTATGYSPEYLFPAGQLPDEYRKYRIQYELGEIVWSSKEKTFESTFRIETPEGPNKICELVNTWSITSLLRNASRDGLEIATIHAGSPQVKIGEVINPEIPEEWWIIAEAVENAWFVVRYLDLPLDLEADLNEIVAQREELKDIRHLLDIHNPVPRAITGKLTEHSNDVEKEYAVTLGRVIRLGKFRIFIVIGLAGFFRLTSDDLEFEITDVKRVHVDHFYLQHQKDIHSSVLLVYERLREKGYEVIEHEDYPSGQ